MPQYKIGRIEGEFNKGYHFVINQEGEDLVFYAHEINPYFQPDFEEIEKEFSLKNIIARGIIDHAAGGKKLLGIWSCPEERLGIKKDLAEELKQLIFEEFKKRNPGLEQVLVMINNRIITD